MDCISLINRLNKAAQMYHLSLEARSLFLCLWERFNRLYWKAEWVKYPESQLMYDAAITSPSKLYRARKELIKCGLLTVTSGKPLAYSLSVESAQGKVEKNEGKTEENSRKNETSQLLAALGLTDDDERKNEGKTEENSRNVEIMSEGKSRLQNPQTLAAVGLDGSPKDKDKDKDIYIHDTPQAHVRARVNCRNPDETAVENPVERRITNASPPLTPKPNPFPPTFEEIKAEAEANGYQHVDLDYFWKYYTATEWTDSGGNSIVNRWKAKLMLWNKREAEKAAREKITNVRVVSATNYRRKARFTADADLQDPETRRAYLADW